MKHRLDQSGHPFPVPREERELGHGGDLRPSKARRGLGDIAMWLIVAAAIVMIVELVLGWFDHHALGWFSIVFLAVCFGAFALIALLSFGGGRKG